MFFFIVSLFIFVCCQIKAVNSLNTLFLQKFYYVLLGEQTHKNLQGILFKLSSKSEGLITKMSSSQAILVLLRGWGYF